MGSPWFDGEMLFRMHLRLKTDWWHWQLLYVTCRKAVYRRSPLLGLCANSGKWSCHSRNYTVSGDRRAVGTGTSVVYILLRNILCAGPMHRSARHAPRDVASIRRALTERTWFDLQPGSAVSRLALIYANVLYPSSGHEATNDTLLQRPATLLISW